MILESVFIAFGILVVMYIFKKIDYVIREQRIGCLDSRYILITGCDSGFGKLAAQRFDELGCHVIAACLTENGSKSLRETCSSRLTTVSLDVSKQESVEKCLQRITEILPPNKGLWGIINNAGILNPMVPAEWTPLDDYKKLFTINCLGCISVTKAFIPLVTKEKGRIVNVSSSAGRNALVYLSAYAVSKYGVEAFSDSIRRELRQFGVSVHLIEPGGFVTNIYHGLAEQTLQLWKQLSPDVQQKYGKELVNFVTSPSFSNDASERLDDVVDAYKHALLSRYPRARYVIGQDAKIFVIPVQWLPEWLGDWIINVFMVTRATKSNTTSSSVKHR